LGQSLPARATPDAIIGLAATPPIAANVRRRVHTLLIMTLPSNLLFDWRQHKPECGVPHPGRQAWG
jgi:hypothetical protein